MTSYTIDEFQKAKADGFIKEVSLGDLKDCFKIMVSRTKSHEELSMLCLNFGESLRIRNIKKETSVTNSEISNAEGFEKTMRMDAERLRNEALSNQNASVAEAEQ